MKGVNMELNKPMKYKEICELMNDVYETSGNKRERQLKHWRQYYDIDKDGMYYIIKKEYDENERELIEYNGKYTTYISDILIDCLSKLPDDEFETTLSYYDIYELTSMVNSKFNKCRQSFYDYKKFRHEVIKFKGVADEELDVDKRYSIEHALKLFFETSKSLLKQNVENALDSMERRGLIVHNKTFILYKEPTYYGDVIVPHAPHVCTNEEISQMLDWERQGLELIKCKNKKDLYCRSAEDKDQYYGFILSKINKEWGYDNYTSAQHLILGRKALEIELDYINRKKLNENVQDQLTTSQKMNKVITRYFIEQFVDEYIKLN